MEDRTRSPSTAEVVERMTTRLANTLVVAAGLVAVGLYAGGGGGGTEPQRYQAVSTTDGRVIRVNTENGSVVSCDAVRCTLVHLRGDDLNRPEPTPAAQPPAAVQPPAPQQQLPAPAPQPAAPKAPAADPAPPQQQR